MGAPEVRTLLDFSGRVAIVTGAGSGLGRGIAARFAEAGARVVVHYRSSAAGAREVVERIGAGGGQAVAAAADLTTEEGARALVEPVDGGVTTRPSF